VFIGDSHERGCALRVKDSLNENFEFSGFVKPSASTDALTITTKIEIENLTDRDVLIFWGGSNDVIRKNCNNGLKQILNLVKNNSHTNILLLSLPHRHDLIPTCAVNDEISTFNRKLVKFVNKYQHVSVVKLDLTRQCFTRHGLHLNALGKEIVCNQIASCVKQTLEQNVTKTISLGWKLSNDDSLHKDNMYLQNNEQVDTRKHNNDMKLDVDGLLGSSTTSRKDGSPSRNDGSGTGCICVKSHMQNDLVSVPRRNSSREKKIPITRSKNFLWLN
jgi:hypothetical protein